MGGQILIQLLAGAVVGWLASRITNSKGGLVRNVVIGLLGSYLGSVLAYLLQVNADSKLVIFVFSVIGACLLTVGGKALF